MEHPPLLKEAGSRVCPTSWKKKKKSFLRSNLSFPWHRFVQLPCNLWHVTMEQSPVAPSASPSQKTAESSEIASWAAHFQTGQSPASPHRTFPSPFIIIFVAFFQLNWRTLILYFVELNNLLVEQHSRWVCPSCKYRGRTNTFFWLAMLYLMRFALLNPKALCWLMLSLLSQVPFCSAAFWPFVF